MRIFFYILFAFDIFLGMLLSFILNLAVGVIIASILLFINFITFNIILKIEEKKNKKNML